MRYFTQNERKIVALIYALVGAVLVWAIMLSSGCTYVDVYTHDVTITGNIGK